jgi:hypothetical protein
MPVVVILLSVVLMFVMALAAAVQRTIRALGLRRSQGSEMPGKARAQTMILLGVYLRWANANFLLGMAVYLITSRASAWYYGVAIVALCWIGSLLMGGMARLKPGSAEIVALLIADLKQRREWYRILHNATRLQAIDDLLMRVQAGQRTHPASGLHR